MVKLLLKLLYSSCLTAFPLFLHSLTSLVSNWMCLLLGTQGRPRRIKPFFFFFLQTRNGGHRKTYFLGRAMQGSGQFYIEQQSIPSFPSPWQPHSTFSFCEFDWVTHISGIIRYLSFCDWLIFLSITSSSFIHIAVCVRISFFLKLSNIPSNHVLFILSSSMDTWDASMF